MSYPRGPQQPPYYGPPRQPPRRKSSSGCAFFVVLGIVLVTGFGCYSVGRGDRASNRVTVAETVTAKVTVTVTQRPKPKATRAAKATQSAEPARRRTRQPVQPTRTRRPTQRPEVESGVHPGAFCANEGALGRTKAGTLMRCTSKAGDRARWRSA